MGKTNTFRGFLGALPKNIFAGFVVSLVALPLGLGLAIASEAPPIAGILSAIVGGVVVALLGGSQLTIASLQNGIDTDLFRAEIDVEFVSRLYLNGMRGIRDIEIFPIEQFKIEELFENYLDYHLRAIVTPKGLKSLTLFKSTT